MPYGGVIGPGGDWKNLPKKRKKKVKKLSPGEQRGRKRIGAVMGTNRKPKKSKPNPAAEQRGRDRIGRLTGAKPRTRPEAKAAADAINTGTSTAARGAARTPRIVGGRSRPAPRARVGGSVGVTSSGSSGRVGSTSTTPKVDKKPPKVKLPRVGPSTSVTPQKDTTIEDLFAPAFEEVARSRARAEAGVTGQTQDIGSFEQWLNDRDAEARQWAGQQLDSVMAASAKSREAFAPAQQAREGETAVATGGNADVARLAGIDAVRTENDQMADAAGSTANLANLSRTAYNRELVGQGDVRAAITGNLRNLVNARHNDRQRELDELGTQLTLKRGEMSLEKDQADRRSALDEATLQLMAGEKAADLDLRRYDSETKRLQVISTAEIARARDDFSQMVQIGRLKLSDARLRLDAEMRDAGLSRRDRQLELNALNQATKSRTSATKYINNQYDSVYGIKGTRKWDQDRVKDRQFVRSMITGLAGQFPDLTQSEATAIISARFPGALRVDPRDPYPLVNMVRQYWPR